MSDVLMRVCWVDYVPKTNEGRAPVIRMCGRSAHGDRIRRFVTGIWPHCYLPADETAPNPRGVPPEDCPYQVRSVQRGFESFDGVPLRKVTLGHPKQIETVKERRPTWESDIPFYRRASWDHGLSGYVRVPADRERVAINEIDTEIEPDEIDPISPRVLIGDIEVLPEPGVSFNQMREDVSAPITAVTLYDSYTEDYHLVLLDPDDSADGSAIRADMRSHWDGHELAAEMLSADISIHYCDSEVDLLNKTIALVQQYRPDLLSGWNWIDFDHQYLTDRARQFDEVEIHKLSDIGGVGGYKTETVIDGVPGFDQLEAYDDKIVISESRSLALEYVANEEFEIGKIPAVNVRKAYQNDRSKLAAYNLLDVQLCVLLTERHGIEEFYLDLAELAGIQPYDCYYEKRLVDGYIATRRGPDQILPNQWDREIDNPAGGLVLTPSDGVVENVAVLDLKSLYPSSMITMNISPETLCEPPELDGADVIVPGMPEKESDVGGSIEPSDINWQGDGSLDWSQTAKGFSFSEQGIIPEYVTGLFGERERYKRDRDAARSAGNDELADVYDRRQAAVKVLMNSFYGVLNSPYYRLARDGVGDAITGISRYILWRASEYLEDLGYKVVYGDTDSVLVQLGSDRTLDELLLDARGLCNQLNDHLGTVADDLELPDPHPYAQQVSHGSDQHCWEFEFEKLYARFFQAGTKKRYAGTLRWKDGQRVDESEPPDITGFEAERSDVPKLTAQTQMDVIHGVLDGADFDEISTLVRDRIDTVRTAESIDEIGIPISIGKPLEEYPEMPRVRAVRHSNKHLGTEFGVGDTPWMVHVNRTPVGVSGTDVVALDWQQTLPEGYQIDEERTIRKAFETALEPILSEMDWSFAAVRSGIQTQSAETALDDDPDQDPFKDPDQKPGGVESW